MMRRHTRSGIWLVTGLMVCLLGCSSLHSTQVGNIDSQTVLNGKRFEILLSETGVNLKEAAEIVTAVAGADKGKEAGVISDIIALFQMGPRTGNPVFDDAFSDDLMTRLRFRCPSGRITGLNSIREATKYPVISGEIIKLTGFCVTEGGQP